MDSFVRNILHLSKNVCRAHSQKWRCSENINLYVLDSMSEFKHFLMKIYGAQNI